MSKELIEQLRELSASRKPYATGAHGQIIGMESYRIVANGFALECIDEAADRIEELVRFIEEQDALLQEVRPLIEHAEIVKKECDQLREQVKMLRDAIEFVNNRIGFSSTETYRQWEDIVEKALAATEPKE